MLRNVDTKLHFKQGLVHKEYVSHLYDIFRLYCSNVPKTTNNPPHPKTGKIYVSMTFETFTLPCFNELYDLFYVAGKKVIPNNISEFLTAAGLAYWICDEGSWNKPGRYVTLCTDSFSLAEVKLLIKALNDNFNLKCYIIKMQR